MRTLCALLLCASFSLAAEPSTQPSLQQQCDTLAARWDAKFKAERLTCIVAPPFVVAGDGGDARLRRYVDHTILAAADALHRKFFDRHQPDEPILILLFESAEPYRRLAKKWFGDENVSHFGYFRRDNVMLMNVGTGTGTLVHELVHALIRPDFPQVPHWFNEGLGSLFEQCTLVDNDVRGLANWRLAALQKAIQRDDLRSLSKLIGDAHFYDDEHVGMNYAQARYLLMFLQDAGKLPRFYKDFRGTREEDPTGLKHLNRAIAPQSLDEFEHDWKTWVLELRFE
jgi:hypothetical protein